MVKQLKSFLGKVSYICRFMQALTEFLEPFEKLLKKDMSFKWTQEQHVAFQRIKNVLGSSPTKASLVRGLSQTFY